MPFKHAVLLSILISLTLAGCANQPGKLDQQTRALAEAAKHISPPDWYGIYSDRPGTLTGYGSATTIEEAKEKALADISQRMDVTVTSQTKQDTTVTNGKLDRQASTSIQLATKQRIKNAQIIKQERSPDNIIYIAMIADFRLTEQILAEKLKQAAGHEIGQINWHGSPWLTYSDFIKKITQYAVSPTGGPALDVTTELGRENDRWLLTLNNASTIIEEQDLHRLVAWRNSAPDTFVLGIKTLSEKRGLHRLKADDRFVLTLKSDSNTGYFTLFNVYPDGRIAAMLDSQPLQTQLEFPSLEQQKRGMVLVAETIEPGKSSQDVMLAIKTEKQVNTSMFQQVSGQLAGKDSYKIHQLLQWLAATDIKAISTFAVEIQPR